ncbi:hypothetical protein CONCODRAFT_168719 [Conidiobolus coronatus NRRL 28638]|uniref:RNI-like protein n=1 Tax=Conidiobolus coronatus (strain ATCC 28846 / CBS 209.66 / NRRL 28638) TaxID=796925 RepID=A0A137NTF1_CONC2|nr:hypothetical protein CONCODRAFT_168719 [Conidiobolus coronatus NRRL 28638]|eukprot:KXN66075.1 hypothetical protein CONCODRAFT_168719 [Conidiobolus coronatus NRRL 28638]
MDNNKNINWLNIILNFKFQKAVQFKTLLEISMVSKLVREKLKPVVFKNIGINSNKIQFESNALCIAIKHQKFNNDMFLSNFFAIETDERAKSAEFDYHALKEKHNGGIQQSFNDYENSLKDIKSYSKSFCLIQAKNSGYYLYPLISNFDNLTSLTINDCNIPFTGFADVGKILPNLKKLGIVSVNLVKSSADIIVSSDISFPSNLTFLLICNSRMATTDLLSDPYEYLFNTKSGNYTYENIILPTYKLPLLKTLTYCPSMSLSDINVNLGLEEFLNVNPKLESLNIFKYNLKMDSSLNSLKVLSVDDSICFNSISNISNLNHINTLTFDMKNFDNIENFSKLCRLCPNLVELNLSKYSSSTDPQVLIDSFLTPALPSLFKLKTLHISGVQNKQFPTVFDFANFTQIEELILSKFSSISNVKFDSCKSLKRVKFLSVQDKFVDEFMEKLDKYKDWTFNFERHKIFGNKIKSNFI